MRAVILLATLALTACANPVHQQIYPVVDDQPVANREPGAFSETRLTRPDGAKRQVFTARADRPKATVIYLHGNAEKSARSVRHLLPYLDAGYNVIVPEFTGHGPNDGRPSEAELRADTTAAIDYAAAAFPDTPIVLVGFSLGGALAVLEGGRDPDVDAIITLAAFSRIVDFAPEWVRPAEALNRANDYDVLAVASEVTHPWIMLHCESDPTANISMAEALFAASNQRADFRRLPCAQHFIESGTVLPVLAALNFATNAR